MKKIFLILLFVLPAYFLTNLYFLDKHPFLCPIEYKGDIIIRSDSRGNGFFSAKRSGNRVHEGIDLLAEIGAPVYASRSGIVTVSRRIESKDKKTGSGNYIVLYHLGNITTSYAHLAEVYVNKYQFVRQGQIIGRVGKTGNANYSDIHAHLHFEVRKNGIPQDPLEYLQ
jgi:murein DD-endopeptidase MepM/ murein hydrolase activator NlpD